MPNVEKDKKKKTSFNFVTNGLWQITVPVDQLKHILKQLSALYDFGEATKEVKFAVQDYSFSCSEERCKATLTFALSEDKKSFVVSHGWHTHGETGRGTGITQLWRDNKTPGFQADAPATAVKVINGCVADIVRQGNSSHNSHISGAAEVRAPLKRFELLSAFGVVPRQELRVIYVNLESVNKQSRLFDKQQWSNVIGAHAEVDVLHGLDLTEQEGLILVRAPGPDTSLNTESLVGWEYAMAAVVLQMGNDHDLIRIVRSFYEELMDSRSGGASISRRKGDHKVLLTGNSFVETNKLAFGPGYAASIKYRNDSARSDPGLWDRRRSEFAAAVFSRIAASAPFMWRYKDRIISKLVRAFTLGDSATTHISLGVNMPVSLHKDQNDGDFSIVMFYHGGNGTIEGGMFCLPTLGVRFIPTDCTVVIFPARTVLHGTTPLKVTGTATLYGSSHFIKVPQVDQLVALAEGCRLAGKNLAAIQAEVLADVEAAVNEHEVKKVKQEAVELRSAFIQAGKDAGVEGCVLAPDRDGFTGWKLMTGISKGQGLVDVEVKGIESKARSRDKGQQRQQQGKERGEPSWKGPGGSSPSTSTKRLKR